MSRKCPLMNMHRQPLLVLAGASLFLTSSLLRADDQNIEKPQKTVRLVWFPRFSPDGKWLITAHGSWDAKERGEVRVWDVECGKPKYVIPTDRGVRTVAWSPNGKFFVAGNYGGAIELYDADTGRLIDQMKLPNNIEVLQISPDEKRLIVASGDGSVRIWELPAMKEVYLWRRLHRGGIWGMVLSPDGKTLATGGQDHFARILDMENFSLRHEIGHPADVNGLVFTNDNKFLLTGCGDALIRVFDVASGAEMRQMAGHTRGSVTDLQFSADGKLLASGAMDATVRLWDMADFQHPKLRTTIGGFDDLVFGVAISPKSTWLAAGGWDDQVKVFDLVTQREKWSWRR